MKKGNKVSKRHRGKPQGIARKVAAQKQSIFEKECVSIDGVAADFREYSDFFEVHCEQYGHAADAAAEVRLVAAFKNAIRDCDEDFFKRLALLARRQKRAIDGKLADPLGAKIIWALKNGKAKPATVLNVLKAIGPRNPDGGVYEDSEVRRAMQQLGLPIEKKH